MADGPSKNVGRLDSLFEPHEEKLDILTEALGEISKERAEKRKEAAKELIRKALDLKDQMNASRKEFEGKSKKFDKELGKVMNRLQNMAKGKPLDAGDEDVDGGGDEASENDEAE